MILSLFYQFFAIINPINFHLYHYAGNSPVRYVDPDGRIFNTSELKPGYLKRFNIAISELKMTERGKFVIQKLEQSETVFTIRHNNDNKNKYYEVDKSIEWDSNKFIFKSFNIENGKIMYKDYDDSITLLFHELGHAFQDLNGELPKNPSFEIQELFENKNIKENENPVAKSRNNYQRKSHSEFLHSVKKTPLEFIRGN